MSGYRNSSDRQGKAVIAWRAAFALALLCSGVALAQEVQAPPPAEPPPTAAPGFLDALGRWLDDSKAQIDNQIKGTQQAIEGAAKDAAKAGQAGSAVLGWPGTKRANGRVRCAVAPNGAPDCAEAANALCRSKGYGPGKSLEINTADKCPTWVWLSARPTVFFQEASQKKRFESTTALLGHRSQRLPSCASVTQKPSSHLIVLETEWSQNKCRQSPDWNDKHRQTSNRHWERIVCLKVERLVSALWPKRQRCSINADLKAAQWPT